MSDMKNRGGGILSGAGRRGDEGFALIITLTLMAFVVLLLVSLLTLARVETTSGSNQLKMNQAKENARLALNIAIGELQRTAGPDDRITAQARLLDPDFLRNFDAGSLYNVSVPAAYPTPSPGSANLRGVYDHPFWTGVLALNPASPNPDDPANWHWLVSGNENIDDPNDQNVLTLFPNSRLPYIQNNNVSPFNRDSTNGFLPDDPNGEWITLVGEGSVNRNADDIENGFSPDPFVYVRAQAIFSNAPGIPTPQRVGRYAWWVGDESVKANLAVGSHEVLADLDDGDRRNQAMHSASATRYGFDIFTERGASAEEDIVDPTEDRWSRLRMIGQAPLLNGIEEDDIRQSFHSFTAYSRSVLSDPTAPPNTPRLKVDLTRDPEHNNLPGNDFRNALLNFVDAGRWIGTAYDPPKSLAAPLDPDGSTVVDYFHPLRHYHYDDPTRRGPVEPVIQNLRLRGVIETTGHGQPFRLRITPEIEIWNPYTTDIVFRTGSGDDIGQTGYHFIIRLTNKVSEVGDPFFLRLGAGIHWRDNTLPPADRDSYVAWLPDEDLELFREGGTLEAGDYHLQFASNEDIRLRAGDVYLLTGESLEFGPGGTEWENDYPKLFDPPRPTGDAQIVNSIATLYVFADDAGDLAPLELTVHAVPAGAIPSFTNKQYVIFRQPIGTPGILFEPSEDVVQDGDVYGDMAELEAVWNGLNPYAGSGGGGGEVNFNAGGTARFAFGFTGTGALSMNNDPRGGGGNNAVEFYSPPGPLSAWGSTEEGDDRFGTLGFSGNDRRGMVRFDVPNDISDTFNLFPGNTNKRRGVVSSIGQLQHLFLPGFAPFSVGSFGNNDAEDLNTDLWDSFYFSTLFPFTGDPNELTAFNVLEFINPRYQIHRPVGLDSNDILTNLEDSDRAASNLLVKGGFNVNSVSVEAWATLLHGEFLEDLSYIVWNRNENDFEDRRMLGRISKSVDPDLNVAYPRFSHAPGITLYGRLGYDGIGDERSIWRNGYRELRPLDLATPINASGGIVLPLDTTPTNPLAGLTDLPVYLEGRGYFAEEMARIIVAEIRKKVDGKHPNPNIGSGPFTSVAEFVNSGILQEAIDEVRWRESFDDPLNGPNVAGVRRGLNWYVDVSGTWREMPDNAPSFLSQRDILSRIGSFLTVRADTFVIRTYGEVRNPVTHDIEAVAYGEAVVQRIPQPFDWDSVNDQANPTTALGRQFGRKFEIISFRWLSPDEI